MIDFHSHILPGLDDGSRNSRTSLRMIKALKTQGVDTICATSHFYATQRSREHYLRRRREAFDKLCSVLPENSPRILLGAEILYYPGISRMEKLDTLCLEGTNVLLLEMPFESWSKYMIREVNELSLDGRFQVVLAHIERYYFKQDRAVWDTFLENGILMQSNAEFFLSFRTRGKAFRLLKEGRIHLLGTDCHNMSGRAPRMDEAVSKIEKRLGKEYLDEIDSLGCALLKSRPR